MQPAATTAPARPVRHANRAPPVATSSAPGRGTETATHRGRRRAQHRKRPARWRRADAGRPTVLAGKTGETISLQPFPQAHRPIGEGPRAHPDALQLRNERVTNQVLRCLAPRLLLKHQRTQRSASHRAHRPGVLIPPGAWLLYELIREIGGQFFGGDGRSAHDAVLRRLPLQFSHRLLDLGFRADNCIEARR